MQSPNLGRLEKVDLRTIWTNEASSFTPWLAVEANLKLLGDAVGLDLALEAQEQNVGAFRADILCKDTAQDHWVLIENQLERTDHTHLGQLITYAAGLHAVTIVWVAARFTDEHRAALDWLNEVTNENISFFGLEVELWRIGDSMPAPKFNVVSQPNQFVKQVTTAREASVAKGNPRYIEYWQAFKDFVEANSQLINPPKPSTDHWKSMAIGRSGFGIRAMAGFRDKYTMVDLWIANDPDGMILSRLEQDRGILDAKAPGATFNPKIGKKESTIEFVWYDSDPNDENLWSFQHERMLRHLEAFHTSYSSIIRSLP